MIQTKTQQQKRSSQATQTIEASTSSTRPQEPQQDQSASTRRERTKLPSAPVLRFSPTAWAKLLYFRDHAETEIGGFGISPADNLLLMEDFITIKQDVSIASVMFDDESVADFFENQVDAGRKPEQFARVWLHTHPGDSPQPSATDEETFRRVFGQCQWAVMFILAKGGKNYARLRFSVGPGGQILIPVEVDYSKPFGPSDHTPWETEYKTNIKADKWPNTFGSQTGLGFEEDVSVYSCPDDWLEELEAMDPAERRLIMDELAARPDLWQETEVIYDY